MRWFFRRGLRVLMYHRASLSNGDALTVTTVQLHAQLRWLREQGFQFVTVAEVLRGALPQWPVLVTFDDAYGDTFEFARPLLRTLRVPAVVFVPTAFIGRTSSWDRDAHPIMNANQLRTLTTEGFELGLHSHRHQSYAELTAAQIAEDVRENCSAFNQHGISPMPALAYPYGCRPREGTARAAMKAVLGECGVRLAFRIGNRINPLPLADPLEIQRLSMRGDVSLGAFQRQIAWGRLL